MPGGLRHPYDGSLYELDAAGDVVVTRAGATGTFTADGRWLRGELREADPHMCGWVATTPDRR